MVPKTLEPQHRKERAPPPRELPNPLTTEAPGKQLRPLHVTRITTTTSPRVHESYWTPAPTTTTTASRRRQSQVTRIICLGRPRHHRQFGDPGQQTPTTSAHHGDTVTTLRPAHVPSSFRSHCTHSDPAESMASSLNNTTTTSSSRRRYHKGHPDHLPLASSTRTQKSVSPGSRRPRQVPTLVT